MGFRRGVIRGETFVALLQHFWYNNLMSKVHSLKETIPVNKAELEFFNKAKAKGWWLQKRGWPDFFCIKPDGTICLVEVKGKRGHQLKSSQRLTMERLSEFGVPCFRWSPDGGLEKIFKPISL